MVVSPNRTSHSPLKGNTARILDLAQRLPVLNIVIASEYLNIHRDTVRRGFRWLVERGYARFINYGQRGRGNSLTIEAVPLHERQEERHAHATTRN